MLLMSRSSSAAAGEPTTRHRLAPRPRPLPEDPASGDDATEDLEFLAPDATPRLGLDPLLHDDDDDDPLDDDHDYSEDTTSSIEESAATFSNNNSEEEEDDDDERGRVVAASVQQPSTSCSTNNPYAGVFEGPEKTLEVCFTPGIGDPRGCRALDRSALDAILAEARCEILSKTSNAYLDAYVLSESSLFVYPHKVVIKTCGRTTLLRCLRRLVQFATADAFLDEDDDSNEGKKATTRAAAKRSGRPLNSKKKKKNLGLRLEWVGYSRKNYCYPDEQPSPHTSFGEELAYLKAHSRDASLLRGGRAARSAAFDGHGYVLGPITGDHWFVYVSDQCERPAFTATERTINVMMFDLDDDVRDAFYLDGPLEQADLKAAARAMTRRSGLEHLVHAENGGGSNKKRQQQNSLSESSRSESSSSESSRSSSSSGGGSSSAPLLDAHAFAPCGYSMNALSFESYTTVHVTPEKECSYASFETNTALKSYGSLVKNVLAVFKPKRVVITLFADEAGLSQLPRSATFDGLPRLDVANVGRYQRSDYSSLHVECDCVCLMANYVLCDKVGSVPDNSRLAAKHKLDKLNQKLPGPQLHVGSLP